MVVCRDRARGPAFHVVRFQLTDKISHNHRIGATVPSFDLRRSDYLPVGIQRSVKTRESKYVYNSFDYEELYDLVADPGEMVNLFGRPEYVNAYITVGLAPFGPGIAVDN